MARLKLSSMDTDVTTHSAATLCYAAPEYVKSGKFPLFSRAGVRLKFYALPHQVIF